ncbi:hypothetical protein [Archangium sp.]|uniref:transmembrane-type terpene cyclase n=1 Tax=Archangium sp. TaxID=1872627 RepID=UPI00389A057B
MTLPPIINVPLLVGIGLFWTIAYVLILRRGFKDKALAMPMLALSANISWEFLFGFIYPSKLFGQRYFNIGWFLLDVGILLQALLFGARDFRTPLARKLFYAVIPVGMLVSVALLVPTAGWLNDFPDQAAQYSGFVINIVISVLFVAMLFQRDSIAGQSMYIGFAKMLGTLCAFLTIFWEPLPRFTYSLIFVFDVAYLLALYVKLRQTGLSPWRRL